MEVVMRSCPSVFIPKNIFRFLPVLLVAAVMGCSDGSSSDSGANSDPEIKTTVPDGESQIPEAASPDDETPPAAAVPPSVDNDAEEEEDDQQPPVRPPRPTIAGDHYDRPYDYPGIVTLPLEFFPMETG